MSSKLWEIKVQESHQSSDSVFMMGKVFIKFEKNLFYWLWKLQHLKLKTWQRKLNWHKETQKWRAHEFRVFHNQLNHDQYDITNHKVRSSKNHHTIFPFFKIINIGSLKFSFIFLWYSFYVTNDIFSLYMTF